MAQATNPNIAAATSPTYPPYSPYAPHDLGHYQAHPPPAAYGHQAPQWAPQHATYPPPMPGGPYASPGSATPGTPASTASRGQVYSFVPIPGAAQHKRPRRRYEEIERMYRCGWQGCEKAYGTLNHLNAHVTMQSHGSKRTPEEFKDIRKEWKQRKKEEETTRKSDDDRIRQSAPTDPSAHDPNLNHAAAYSSGARPQLPPLGYGPAGGQVAHQYPGAVDQMYSAATNGQVYAPYPPSPYGASGQQM